MKKQALLLVFALFALFTKAQGIISNQTGAGQVSDKTAQVSAGLYGAAGTNYKVVVVKKTNATNFAPDDSVYVTGLGFTNPVPVMFTLDSLNPSTTYYYEFRLYKAYSDSTLLQTTSAGYSFTTTATPQSGTITSVTVQPIGGGLRIIVNGNTNGSTSNLIAYANEATFSGGGWNYHSETDVLPGVFTSFTDTLVISNLNSVSHKIQVRLLPTNGMPAVISSFYYGTPLAGTKPTVNTPSISPGVDSVRIFTNVTKGNTDSNWVFIRIFDSIGNSVIMTLPTQLVASNLQNYFRQIGLTANTLYVAEIVAYNSVGRDSGRFSFRTLPKVKLAAPSVAFTSVNSPNCGYILLGGIRVTPVTGDTARAYILMSSDGQNTFDTVWSRSNITGQLNVVNIRINTAHANWTYYFKLIGMSKDSVVSQTTVINEMSPSGSSPTLLAAVVTPLGIPEVSVSGGGGCDSATITIEVFDGPNRIQYHVVPVGSGLYAKNIQLPGLDNKRYDVNVCIRNSYGPVCQSLVIDRSVLTGVRNNTNMLENILVYPNPSTGIFQVKGLEQGTFKVLNSTGQEVVLGNLNGQINIEGFPSGIYFIQLTNKKGEVAVKQLNLAY